MGKPKKKYKYIVPIYNQEIVLLLCDRNKLPKELRPHKQATGFYKEKIDEDGIDKIFIWIENFDWTSCKMAILVHELSHAVDHIQSSFHLKLDTESRAYLLENLVEYFFRNIIIDIKKRKKS